MKTKYTYKWNSYTRKTSSSHSYKKPKEVIRPIDSDYKINPDYLDELVHIFKYKRPAGGEGEDTFINTMIDTIPGMQKDTFGNRMMEIKLPNGNSATTAFSCHTDTVHRTDGTQKIVHDIENRMISKNDGECLGADDGAGCFILFQLIENKVPGLYLFHREEEIGGNGSDHIAKTYSEFFKNIDRMIAFDRKGTQDIITDQCHACASDQFAYHLADKLGMDHKPDPTGTFTDSANYTHLVSECTNVSIGYSGAHTASEKLDYEYLFKLTDALIQIDFESLVTVRTPEENDPWGDYYGGYGDDFYEYGYGHFYEPKQRASTKKKSFNYDNKVDDYLDYDTAFKLIWEDPNLAAYILADLNITKDEVIDYQTDFENSERKWEDNDKLVVGMS